MAFADGRARGAFADRTIVTLGAPVTLKPAPSRHHRPTSTSPHHWEGRPGGGRRRGRGEGGASSGAASTPGYAGYQGVDRVYSGCQGGDSGYSGVDHSYPGVSPGVSFPFAGVFSETGEQDREIECIRPDGTVVQLSERSLAHRSRFGTSCGFGTGGLGTGGMGTGGLGAGGGSGGGGGFGSTGGGGVAGAVTAARLRRGDADHPLYIAPYVAAVRRFADWALADPDERRARARRGADGRLAAAAEAERNRRFVALQRLVKPPPSRRSETAANNATDQSAGGSFKRSPTDRFLSCPVEGKGGGGGAGEGGSWSEGNKENVGCAEERARWGSNGARERNALVNRLLEANREVLVGREALRRFGL